MAYENTMRALGGLGEGLIRLTAIDAARRNAAMEHELNLKRLNIGRETAEAQNRLGLLTTERGMENQRAENEYRMAELENRRAVTDKQTAYYDYLQKKQEEADAEKKWMNEAGNFETLYRGSLAKQGLEPKQIDDTIANFAKLGGGLGAQMLITPTIRAKMYDVLGDMPRMIQAERAAARLLGQSTSAADKLHNALVKAYQGKAAWLTQHGIGADTPMARSVLQAAAKDGVDLTFETKDVLTEVPNTDPKTSGTEPTMKVIKKMPVWMANDYDPNILVSRELGNTYNKLYEKNPWLANVSQEEAADLAGKVLINPAAKNQYLQEIIMNKPELSGQLFNATKPPATRKPSTGGTGLSRTPMTPLGETYPGTGPSLYDVGRAIPSVVSGARTGLEAIGTATATGVKRIAAPGPYSDVPRYEPITMPQSTWPQLPKLPKTQQYPVIAPWRY